MRYNKSDNMKALLIFSVVLGHLCEIVHFNGSYTLYMFIYVFHMPAFALCSGLFASFHPKKIFKNLVFPYVIFQTLYILFSHFVLNSSKKVEYTTPYWLMWYLFAMILWECAIPLLETTKRSTKLLWLGTSTAISLLVGYFGKISYFLSLSRILVLFPFFIAGFYLRRSHLFPYLEGQITNKKYEAAKAISAVLTAVVVVILFSYRSIINSKWLYGSYSYDKLDYNLFIRAGFMICAAVITVFLMVNMPGKEIPFITNAGRHTFPIFLLHGFFIKLFGHYKVFSSSAYPELVTLAVAISLVLILSSRFVGRLTRPLLHPDFSRIRMSYMAHRHIYTSDDKGKNERGKSVYQHG